MTQSRSVAALAAAGGGATSLWRGWIEGAEAAAAVTADATDAAAAVAMVRLEIWRGEIRCSRLCFFSIHFLTRGRARSNFFTRLCVENGEEKGSNHCAAPHPQCGESEREGEKSKEE